MNDISNLKFKFKYDYAKLPRNEVHTTINRELHKKLKVFCAVHDQPMSKAYDVMIMDVFENQKTELSFLEKLKKY